MIRRLSLLSLLAFVSACGTTPSSDTPETQLLLRASAAWDGSPYPSYATGTPELSLLKIRIPPDTTLDWHRHPSPNAGYLLAGELQVETREGQRTRVQAGEALAEVMDRVHRGRSGSQGAELIVFYAGTPGLPLAEKAQQAPASSQTFSTAAPSTLTALLDSIDQRLDLAEAVALYKWDHGQPVQVAPRERQVLDQARRQSSSHGLDEQRAADFFADQIEANRLLQYGALSGWYAEGRAPEIPRRDLGSQLRPRLDHLRDELLARLAAFDQQRPPRCEQVLAQALQQRGSDPLRRVALTRASGRLCAET
ncbi:gamma subclass chorismate mutase AroQ [Pseudomonas japonica]|uniref:gamma subclass chorismate mutase AroQ n=1 Tax=Pseudomonas japonica TaxID=256466 RepID=UPI0038110816